MGSRTLALSLLLLLAACAGAAAGPEPDRTALVRFEFERPAMGTRFRVLLFAPDEACAAAGAEAAFARIAALERVLSDYDPDSELTRLGAGSDAGVPSAPIPLSAELCQVLVAAQGFARASGGAFDVTAGPYVRLWRRARRQGELPSAAALAAAAPAVGFEKLELDPRACTARLLAPGMRLDLGGIGKGYALDAALAELAARGFEHALVVGGGDVRAGAAPPGTDGWRVALASFEPSPAQPEATLTLAHAALSTSGDLAQHLELAGVRHSHVLDPRSGRAVTERCLASVLASDGTTADALATALSVLGPGEGLALAARTRGVEARLLVLGPGGVAEFRTPRFPRLSCAQPDAPSSP